jgi:sulfofructose kinase
MKNNALFDVVGVGRAVMDYCVLIEQYPEPDEKTEAVDRFYGSGSPVPNALCQLAVWDHNTSLVAKVGDDSDGTLFIDQVKSLGVNCEHVTRSSLERTPRAHIWVTKSSGSRTIVLDRDIAPLSQDLLPSTILERSNFLLLDGYEADVAIRAAQIVHVAGGEVILDAGNIRPRMEEQLALADWVIVPLAFAKAYFDGMDLFDVVRDLLSKGAKGAIVTNGAAGSVSGVAGGNVEWIGSYPVKVVDTTGAGDIFHAGIIHGLINGWDLADTIKWASAAGALATTKLGGRGMLPTKSEVSALLLENGVNLK